MTSFKEWLYAQLLDEGYIKDDVDVDELTEEMLLTETELYDDDIAEYKSEFEAHCQNTGEDPDWDLPEA